MITGLFRGLISAEELCAIEQTRRFEQHLAPFGFHGTAFTSLFLHFDFDLDLETLQRL